MATSTVAVRLPAETVEKISARASKSGQTISEWVRQLIQKELSEEIQTDQHVGSDLSDRLETIEKQLAFHHNALGELLVKAVRVSAASRYFARLAASYGQDITSYLTTQAPLDSETKAKQMARFEAKCTEFEKDYLLRPLEEV